MTALTELTLAAAVDGLRTKAFSAVELTEGRITGAEIRTILGWGHAMLQAPEWRHCVM